MSETWLNPIIIIIIIIARVQMPYKNLLFQFRGDMRGFEIGSNFAYQAQVDVTYNFSKYLQTAVGYRIIDMDYETGSRNDRFLHDVTTFGPLIKFGFKC